MFRSIFGGFTDLTRGKRIDYLSHPGATRALVAETFRKDSELFGYDVDSSP